jgi:hypothetical protein
MDVFSAYHFLRERVFLSNKKTPENLSQEKMLPDDHVHGFMPLYKYQHRARWDNMFKEGPLF